MCCAINYSMVLQQRLLVFIYKYLCIRITQYNLNATQLSHTVHEHTQHTNLSCLIDIGSLAPTVNHVHKWTTWTLEVRGGGEISRRISRWVYLTTKHGILKRQINSFTIDRRKRILRSCWTHLCNAIARLQVYLKLQFSCTLLRMSPLQMCLLCSIS